MCHTVIPYAYPCVPDLSFHWRPRWAVAYLGETPECLPSLVCHNSTHSESVVSFRLIHLQILAGTPNGFFDVVDWW